MHIQEVRIQNFRVFGDEGISFTFNKGINVVIGENNNGKTALIDAIRIAFSCALYKKDIFFSKTDFHVNAAGKKATSAQIDVYLKDVPQNLIEIWDPIQPDCGEFHVVFTLEKTPSGTDKVKYRAWGGKCEGNPLSADTLEAINLAYLSALRDATNEMKPSRKVAIVTRGRIHSDNSIDNLWKTPETELLARASFEWMCGNRKKAYSFCEKALFQLIIKDSKDIDVSIERDVSQIMPYAQWKQVVIEILIRLPSANEQCGQWVTNSRVIVHEMLTAHNMSLRNGATITDSIKIKTRDTQNPDFKRIPIKDYFEIRSQTEYTRSSVHGVKGETFDALMLLIHGTRGKTLTPSFLTNGNTDTELMRIAYVAMTRPRKLLVVAMPKSTAQLETRFSKEKWDYVEV